MTLWLTMLHHHSEFSNKMSVVQKTASVQTFTDILNLRCDLDLERSNQFFFHRTLRLMILFYQTKFGRKRSSSLEDMVQVVIF